jgi:uncharacterized membrane protein YgaE (UPF0421/DUF939 family)
MSIHPTPPKIGGRTFKTLMSVTIIAIVYGMIGRNACFAAIGAVFGLGNTIKGGIHSGGNRFVGTFVGGIVALPFYWLYHHTPFNIPEWAYLPVGIFLLIYICQIFNIEGGIHPGAVVFFVTIYTVAESSYISYVVARIIDTGIGVAFSLLISSLWPSPYEVPKYSGKSPMHGFVPSGESKPAPLDMEQEA